MLSHTRRLVVATFGLVLSSLAMAPRTLRADHLEEVIIYDTTRNQDNQDEGLARQRLGLLDAFGNPDPGATNVLPPLVSADGLKRAVDIGAGDTFAGGFDLLKADGGVLVVLLHGRTGVIAIGATKYKGFGTGTGVTDACIPDAYPLDGEPAKTNMTIHLVVCQAGASGGGVTSVATTLRDAIVALGGSVSTINSTNVNAVTIARRAWRKRAGATMSAADSAAASAAIGTTLVGTDFKNKWKTLQQRLDAAVAPDGTGSRAIAKMLYIGKMGATEIQKTADEPGPFYDDESSACTEDCPLGVTATSWGVLKTLFR